MSAPRMFRFDLLDRTGVFLGLGLAQLALLAAGTLATTVALTAGAPLPIAAAPVVVAAVAALARRRGVRLIELGPIVVSWILYRRQAGWRAPLGLFDPNARDLQPPLPRWLAGVELHEAPTGWGRLAGSGIVHDTTTGEMSTLVRVRAHAFALAARDEQIRLLAGWGDVLAGFATERGVVCRLTWSDFATPTGMGEHRAWLARQPTVDGPAADSYRALLAETGDRSAGHDVVVTVTARARQLANAGEGAVIDRLASGLAKATDGLLRALRAAGLQADDPLTPSEIATVLRTRLDPISARTPPTNGALAERLGLVPVASAGPLAAQVQWEQLRVDGAWHRVYWVAEWPRLQQHPDWMEPVLAFAGAGSRAVTVIFEPVPPSVSQRRIDRDSIKLESDAAAREDKGRRVGAQHRRLQAAVAEREAELVAGYAEVAYAGLVTVTADTSDALAAACEETEQVAREHGLDVRPLDGRHDTGFAAGLPLGLGLARPWIR
ncbi:MAG: hypothetical protein QOI95_2126 [Acidimicrobiaceae bacterium]|jgi:hypothetical protein